MQGSGTFGIEAVLSSPTPPNGKLLVIINGAYGRRIDQIARVLGIETLPLAFPENRKPDPKQIEATLAADDTWFNHAQTSTARPSRAER